MTPSWYSDVFYKTNLGRKKNYHNTQFHYLSLDKLRGPDYEVTRRSKELSNNCIVFKFADFIRNILGLFHLNSR